MATKGSFVGVNMRSVVREIQVNVSEDQKRRLELIDAEDYSGVIRKVREEYLKANGKSLPRSLVESGIFGLKQYYAMPLLDPMNSHTVSEFVDPFWHAHILHTHQYAHFCQEVFGSFLHHIPLNKEEPEQMQNVAMVYEYTIEILTKLFGDRPSTLVWAEGAEAVYICWGDSRGGGEKRHQVEQQALFPANERGVSIIATRMSQLYAIHQMPV